MNHEAIYNTHASVVRIDDTLGAFDAAGNEVIFKNAGTEHGRIIMDEAHLKIKSTTSDADVFIQGNDGGSGITALRFDMSSAGAAAFNSTVTGTSFNGIPFFSADTSSIYTHDVSGTDDTANYNTAYGIEALDAITTGDDNTALGYQSLSANTTGQRNVAIGKDALKSNDDGGYNLSLIHI
mgnify:CR=1 FL=1